MTGAMPGQRFERDIPGSIFIARSNDWGGSCDGLIVIAENPDDARKGIDLTWKTSCVIDGFLHTGEVDRVLALDNLDWEFRDYWKNTVDGFKTSSSIPISEHAVHDLEYMAREVVGKESDGRSLPVLSSAEIYLVKFCNPDYDSGRPFSKAFVAFPSEDPLHFGPYVNTDYSCEDDDDGLRFLPEKLREINPELRPHPGILFTNSILDSMRPAGNESSNGGGNYHNILGVARNAGPEEIKAAYRHLAKGFHPDVNSDPDAELIFKKVNVAYEALSNGGNRR